MISGHRRAGIVAMGSILCLLGASTAWADGSSCREGSAPSMKKAGHGDPSHGTSSSLLHHLFRHKQALGLSDEQVTKLRTLALDYDRTHIRAAADASVAERELRALLWDQKADLASIEAKVKEQGALEASVRINKIRAKRDLLGVLTPEQRAKLRELRQQRHHGHGASMKKADAQEPAEHCDQARDTDTEADREFAEVQASSSAG